MVLYTCPRCNYESCRKCDIQRHYKRKKKCIVINKNITTNECLKMLEPKISMECKQCNKTFNKKYNLQRHISVCYKKNITEIELIEKKIELGKLEVKKLEMMKLVSTTNTGINNSDINSHNNITNNITINAFKDMDYNLLKDEILLCIKNQDPKLQVPAFENIIDAVHFNKDNPSNHNIYKPNVRDDRILTFNGDDFVVDKMAIDVILKKLEEVIENSIDKENGKVYLKKLKNHLKLKQEDNDYHEATKDDIAVGLYNGRKTVISTHKNLK
jgi:hypothetical protein